MKKIFVIVCMLLCIFGCSKEEYQMGSFDGLTYTNAYFNFSMQYVDGYEVYDEEQMSKTLGITLEQLQQQSMNETFYEYMVSNSSQTPLFQFYVENYKFTTGVRYEDFVAQIVQQFIEQDEIDYTVGAVVDLDIGGVSMKKIPLHINAGYFVVNQDLYMIKRDSYVGTLMITYLDGQEEEVEEIVRSIQLYE